MPEESNKLITEGAKISNQNTGETDSNQPDFIMNYHSGFILLLPKPKLMKNLIH